MSEEITNETETPVETAAAVVGTVIPAPAKRGRGRPKGSKNKPKDPSAPVKEKKPRAPKAAKAVEPGVTKTVTVNVAPTIVDNSEAVAEEVASEE